MPRARPAAVLMLLLAAGCSGSGKVTQVIGKPGFWHLEYVRTSPVKSWISRIRPLARWIDDPAYTGGRWWFVSPEGERKFLRLVNNVIPGPTEADAPAYMTQALANLRSWGFDGFGAWSSLELWGTMPEAPPVMADLAFGGCGIWSGAFEEWVGTCQGQQVEATFKPLRQRREIAGVFWEYPGITSPRLLYVAYFAMDRASKSKQAVVAFLKARCHGRLEELRTRLPEARSFDDLLTRSVSDYEGMDEDATAFLKLVYDTYGARVAGIFRGAIPEYLNLGPILDAGTPAPVVSAVAPYTDVLTFAVRSADGRISRRYFDDIHELTGKPVVLTVWGQGLRVSRRIAVETEAGQAIAYRRCAGAAASLPFVAGLAYSGYRDAPDEADGLLDATGRPRQLVVGTVSDVNASLDSLHRNGGKAFYQDYFDEDRFVGSRARCLVERLPRPIQVDGDLGDWPGSGCWLGEVKLTRDLDPVVFCGVRIGWDEAGLDLGLEIQDDSVDLLDPRVYWRYADYLEAYVDGTGARPAAYGAKCFHLVLLPRGGGDDGAHALAMAMHHPGDGLPGNIYDFKAVDTASSFFRGAREVEHTISIGSLRRQTKFTLKESSWKQEVRIPWSLLGVAPKPGLKLGFNFIAHRFAHREEGAFWAAPRNETSAESPSRWGQLELGERLR